MPSWLPPPVIKRSFGTDGGSFTRAPAIVVLHSTEGGSTTSYQDGAVAPHFTLDVDTGQIWQHVPLDRAARALANPSGGVETNRAGCIQVEIIGTCDGNIAADHPSWPYMPALDARQQGNVRALLDLIHDALPAIPLTTSVPWKAYPASYGSNGVRFSSSKWGTYKGICGHMHVPENSHGDPGALPIADILTERVDDFEMFGMVKCDDKAAQFIYTGTGLIWLQDADHKSRICGEYEKQTGRPIILTTIGSRGAIERGLYGWLPPAAPDPTSAGVESGWDFSRHRTDLMHGPDADMSDDLEAYQAQVAFHTRD